MKKYKEDLLLKCQLMLLAMKKEEVVIPLIHMETYMNIIDYKDECVEKLFELTNKEIPMKPINQYQIDFGLGNYGDCRICNYGVNYQQNYCDNCGQKIYWRD